MQLYNLKDYNHKLYQQIKAKLNSGTLKEPDDIIPLVFYLAGTCEFPAPDRHKDERPLVVIESAYRPSIDMVSPAEPITICLIKEKLYEAELALNIKYACLVARDAMLRSERWVASHLKYTQKGILDDTIEHERVLGIAEGLVDGLHAHKTAVYWQRGISGGMVAGIKFALFLGREVELRSISEWEHPFTSLEYMEIILDKIYKDSKQYNDLIMFRLGL